MDDQKQTDTQPADLKDQIAEAVQEQIQILDDDKRQKMLDDLNELATLKTIEAADALCEIAGQIQELVSFLMERPAPKPEAKPEPMSQRDIEKAKLAAMRTKKESV